MIRDVLLPALQQHFPGRGLQINPDSNPIATFPAAHAAVGAVTVWEEGVEATVIIEHLAHSHFSLDEPNLSHTEIDRQITENVVDFLEALFQDRVLFWISSDQNAGGWHRLDLMAETPLLSREGSHYVWSGPIADLAAFAKNISDSQPQP